MNDGFERDNDAKLVSESHVAARRAPPLPSGLARPARLPAFRVPVRVTFPDPQFAPPPVPQPFARATSSAQHATMRPPPPSIFDAPYSPPTLAPLEMAKWTGPAGDSTMILDSVKRGRVSPVGIALLFAGVTAGLLIGVAALDPGAFARGRAALTERVTTSQPAERAAFGAPPPAAPLPAPIDLQIGPDATLLTFGAASTRPSIVIDGVVVPSAALPARIACGRHTVQVGTNAPRVVDLPCGASFSLDR